MYYNRLLLKIKLRTKTENTKLYNNYNLLAIVINVNIFYSFYIHGELQ